jgi:septum formation protein
MARQSDHSLTDALILASASPRRRDLLQEAGVVFEVDPSEVPESPGEGEDPVAYARRTAAEKGVEVAARRRGRWVLAADTVVVLDTEAFGKPADAEEARGMLRRLSGRTHEVVTAFVLVAPDVRLAAERSVTTRVTFREIPDLEVEAYVAGGEAFGKAGAYAIQGDGGRFVTGIQGSWNNVVGLPVDEVLATLRAVGRQ